MSLNQPQSGLGWNGENKGIAGKYVALPGQTWTTIDSGTGQGTIKKIWLSLQQDRTPYRVRITFDGAATPQVGGFNGVPVDAIFGSLNLVNNTASAYRAKYWRQARLSQQGFTGTCNIPMPFGTSYKIEIYGPATNYWSIVERKDAGIFPFDVIPGASSYRFYCDDVLATVGGYTEQTVLDNANPTIFLGMLWTYSGSAQGTLEGRVRYYTGPTPSLIYTSSGIEDYHDSGWYFGDGLRQYDDNGLLQTWPTPYYINSSKTSGNSGYTAYRMYDLADAPANPTWMRVTWQNGDPASANPGPMVLRVIRFYYASAVSTPAAAAAPTLSATTGGALSWSAIQSPHVVGWRLRRGGTLIADLPATKLSYYDNSLTATNNGTSYTYSLTAYDHTGQEGTAGTATITYAYNANALMAFGYTTPISGATNGAAVSSWPDTLSGNSNNASQSNGAKQPTYNSSDPSVVFASGNEYQAADSASLDIVGDITLAAYIYWGGASGGQCICSKAFSGNSSYWMELYNGTPNFGVTMGGTSADQVVNSAPFTLTASTWTKIAVTYSPSNGVIKWYLNGSPQATFTNVVSFARIFNSTAALEIGQILNGGNDPFVGRMQWVKGWARVLTDAEVAAL